MIRQDDKIIIIYFPVKKVLRDESDISDVVKKQVFDDFNSFCCVWGATLVKHDR